MGDKCDKFGRLCNGNGGEDEGKGVKWGRKDIKVNGGGRGVILNLSSQLDGILN